MGVFALVFAGRVVQISAVVFPVYPKLMWTTDISTATPAPQVGWSATQSGGTWTFAAPAAPPGPALAQQAQAALNAMDAPGGCAIRCFKAGVPFPAAWQAYCTEMRAIVNGTASPMPTALPVQPAFPTGT